MAMALDYVSFTQGINGSKSGVKSHNDSFWLNNKKSVFRLSIVADVAPNSSRSGCFPTSLRQRGRGGAAASPNGRTHPALTPTLSFLPK